MTKVCTKCGERKPATREHFSLSGVRGRLHAWCKPCRSKENTKYNRGRKEYFRQWRLRHRAKNREELNRRARDQYNPQSRWIHIISKYGLTVKEYKEMEVRQGGKCAICGGVQRGGFSKYGRLCIDHNHATGKVRGLLCHQCNRAIGLLEDSSERLRRAADYLEKDK